MAQRRMFSLKIVDTDAFLDMPMSAQALYFHLGMRADDDGFIANAKKIQRSVGAAEDDLKLLLAKRFLLAFDSGVIVVKHWKVNNYIQKDRYVPTLYKEEYACLYTKENGIYTDHPEGEVKQLNEPCIQNGYTTYPQDRLGKVSIDKNNIYSPEPQNDSGPKVASLPLNTGEEYPIYQKDLDEWQELYPAVDVKQQLNAMRGWCMANPTKKKTSRGIKRFINGWLQREQDRGGSRNPVQAQPERQDPRKGKKYKTILNEEGYWEDVEVSEHDG